MRITQKLGVLVAVPLCAVSGFGALALITSTSGAMQASRLSALMNAADAAASLIARLQDERTAVATFMIAPSGARPMAVLDDQTGRTDAAIAVYREQTSKLRGVPQDTKDLTRRIDSELSALPGLRAQIRSGSAPALTAVIFQYRIAVADLLTLQESAAQAGSAPPHIADQIHAVAALSQAGESAAEEEVEVLRLAIGTPLTPYAQQDITVLRTGYTGGLETFSATAEPDWRSRPAQALAGPQVAEAGRLEDLVARTPAGGRVVIDARTWTAAMSARQDALDGVRAELDGEILDGIAAERDHQRALAEIEAASVAATMLVVMVVSLRVGRPMIRGLRQLRESAHAVAYEHLPAAVEALQVPGALDDRTPEEFADEIGTAVAASGDDEIAAVGRAFNTVHREAVRTAADMELLRAGVGAAFVALARRGERLTGALTAELDKAEKQEEDPDRLATLFVLDHLAARMSRNNESLLVLGGEATARVRAVMVPLLDALRGALGRVERYSRVDIGPVDPGIMIAPDAVDHLVHLCAELMDNATAFSAPTSRVTAQVAVMTDRIIMQIADRGIGLTDRQRQELNARLSAPRAADLTAVQAMGVTVSARLASWHGITVELRARPGGGTTAEITVPAALYRIDTSEQAPGADAPTVRIPVAEIAVAAAAVAEAAVAEAVEKVVEEADTRETAPVRTSHSVPEAADDCADDVDDTAAEPAPSPSSATAQAVPADEPTAQTAERDLSAPTAHVEPAEPAAPPEPDPAATTLHGLPKRVPLARIPADFVDEPDTPDAEDQRDSAQVSSVLAAYARGIGSHNPQTPNADPTR